MPLINKVYEDVSRRKNNHYKNKEPDIYSWVLTSQASVKYSKKDYPS
jgi:hypothetical protein